MLRSIALGIAALLLAQDAWAQSPTRLDVSGLSSTP